MPEARAGTLFEDEHLLVVDKPAGRLVISGRGEAGGVALVDELSEERGSKLFVVHRLDQGTSGALAFAKDAEAHRELSALFEGREVRKLYLAVARGTLAEPKVLEQPLARFGSGRWGVKAGGKPSRTDVRPLEAFGSRATLVEAAPRTGRRHQIRVHLYAAGHPVLGDPLYGRPGEDHFGAPRLMLHAARIAFTFRGRPLEVDAVLPADFAAFLAALRT